MPKLGQDEIDGLLSRGRMSGAARERVLERVVKETAPKRSWMRMEWLGLGVAAAGAAVTLFVIVRSNGRSGFTEKGGSPMTVGPQLSVECVDGVADRCPLGGTLALRAEGADAGGYIAAYAIRAGAPDSARIWYFPTADGSEARLASMPGSQIADRGVRLGSEHTPGRYEVHVVLGSRPLTREDVLNPKAAGVLSRRTAVVDVTP